MRWILCASVVVGIGAAAGCSKKSEDSPAVGSSSATRPIDATAAAPADAPVDVPPDASTVESKYGYCELTFTGAINDTTRVALEPRWVSSDYWLSAKTKAHDAKVDKDIKRQGYTFDDIQKPFGIFCEDAAKGYFVHIDPSEKTKLTQIKQKPADFPIEYHLKAEQKPRQIIGEVLTHLAPLYPSSGTLHITKFQQGELEATFEMETSSIREPPDKVKIVGKIVYHCADYDRCGAG